MTTNHTPGPWNSGDSDLDCSQFSVHANLGQKHSTLLRMVHPKHGMPISEIMANARLIAAAPVLLEACKALMFSFAAFQHEFQNIDESEQVIQCRNAIIKATGATP